RQMAESLSSALTPSTTAYSEIWLSGPGGGEKRDPTGGSGSEESEPLYGETYLPRKFKLAISLPHDNCVDVYSHDLGLLAVLQGSKVAGYNVLVGGGFGNTPSNNKTFPALAKPLGFVTPDQVVDVVKAIVKVYRDFGDRSDRKRARLKYLMADWGIGRFKDKVEHYLGIDLPKPWPVRVMDMDDHAGWHDQGDGLCFYGLVIENGRIADRGGLRLKSALRAICQAYGPGIRLTPFQSVLLTHLAQKDRLAIERILRRHGVKLSDDVSPVRRSSMACVALPTCPLAITEAERALPGVVDRLDRELAELGLSDEEFTVRMTGCPNGCARPYSPDIGLVGKSRGKYTLYLGGNTLGTRIGFIYQDQVPLEEIGATVSPLLGYFKSERTDGESFGDFCARKGLEDLQQHAAV
ncbi:MAG: NADPH-dependent assimilatory sulfite reductase hemoprotein subunit, partial [Rhodopirellula sp.]|nr:NADPH-dependent assimilatory sulfite reductase hemoprotein subunit [Rhodopirellula sp.]